MAEEGLDPTSVPLPPTDDTVYPNNAGAIPSSDLHSNAHGSEDGGEDEGEDNVIDEETNNTIVNKNVSDIEEEDEADEMTDLPTPRGKMVTLTPSFNRSTRSRRFESSSELSQTRSMVDEQGDHEMSDEVEAVNNEKEDEEMEDDENDTMYAHLEKKKARRGMGGKVKNHREATGPGVAQDDEDYDIDGEEDEEEEEQGEEEGEEQDQDEEEDGSGSEQEDFDRTIRIPMHTPSRSAVPKRLLGYTSPGRTPIARTRSATTTNTPAGRFPSLDFTTPGIAATSFPATVGRLNLRTPFLYHGTPINISRPGAVQHHQLAVQNELLFDEIKEKEAQIKYLQGLVESAAASPSADPPPLTDAEMEELVSFGDSPENKRVRLSAGGFATPKAGELSVPKTRGKKRGSMSTAATPVPGSSKKGKMGSIETPQTALKGSPVKTLFENMTMTPSRFSVTADSLFGTPTRIPMPQFEMKTKRQRKEDKRRRMTAQLREFSEINIDMLKGWLPSDGAVPEDAEEDGSLPVGPRSVPASAITTVVEEEDEEDKPQEEEPQEEKPQEEKPQEAQDEPAPEKDGDQDMADAALAAEEPAPLSATISAPAQIPTRQLKILPADQVLTTRKRSNSAPAVPHVTAIAEEEEDDADISISPLAQEMITALQQRCLALEREIETSNSALQKATAQLVGEMRARKAAEEVREFLETEKKFGVCCDAARKAVETQAAEKKRKASAAAASSTMPPPAAGKKRTRDEREASTQPEPRAVAARPGSRAAAVRPPSRNTASRLAEKRVHSGPAAAAAASAVPLPPTRPTRATAARAAAAKKPLGKAVTNEQPARHPPITTAMEKPAVRGSTIPRPTSRLADKNEEPAAGRTTRARSGSTAGDGARPMSRYGDRPVRNVDGLDVFGRLATGSRRR